MNTDGLLKLFFSGAIEVLEVVQVLTQNHERFRSIVNGVIGDTLEAEKSLLSIPMQLWGEPRGKKLCILVHGLFDTVHTWQFSNKPARDYGSLLKKDLGYTPLYLSYNTGLHISTNGQALSRLLTQACKKNPEKIREIIFIGHSMGGLVIRSACHYGQKTRAPWVQHVKKIFFLSTPHLGSDWEKLGHLTTIILNLVPSLFTLGFATLGNKRSAGIKDLRFGYLLDEDWKGEKAFWHDNRHPVPLLPWVEYYNVASILAKETKNFFSEYWGDGLVHMRSAAGKSFFKSLTLPFSPKHFKILRGFSHTQVTHHDKVYRQIKNWCR
jgi:pimeloyl-ACP methyl ester carboxylesterase